MSSKPLCVDLSEIVFDGVLKNRGYDESYYTRYIIAVSIVEEIRKKIPKGHNKKLKILDIGGYNGAARELLGDDDVTILDVFNDVNLKNYIKVDSVGVPENDNKFDIVISTDVLEHIEGSQRELFINEAVRVSKYAAVILAPFDSDTNDVSREELFADSIYQGETKSEYMWLKEHKEYGLPKRSWFENLIKSNNLIFARASHTSIRLWGNLITNGYFFANNVGAVDKRLGALLKTLNRKYLKRVAPYDFPEHGYRSIYIISKYFSNITISTPKYNPIEIDQFISESNRKIGLVFAEMSRLIFVSSEHLKEKELIIEDQKQTIINLANDKEEMARTTLYRLHVWLRSIKRRLIK